MDLQGFYVRSMEEILADPRLPEVFSSFLDALEAGAVRAASVDGEGNWHANPWVKQAILAGFRSTATIEIPGWPGPCFDRAAYPPRAFTLEDGVRIVPGGSAVRRGAFVAPGVVIVPPAYVNVGAYVDTGAMVDSHALVGSCAQIGKRVHLSAGAQVGGVLEPAGALPVVVEEEAFVGGLCGLFEGVVVKRRAVLAPGVLLTASTRIYDLVNECEITRVVPEGAVVVPGSRPATGTFALNKRLSLSAPCIVKYRDDRTEASTALEEALR